jgi:hypothetical protein
MAERNEEVFKEIIIELRRRPELSLGVLYQLAVHLDPAIAKVPPRRFNSVYVVPARHQIALESRGARRAPRRAERSTSTPRKGRGSSATSAASEIQPAPPPPEATVSAPELSVAATEPAVSPSQADTPAPDAAPPEVEAQISTPEATPRVPKPRPRKAAAPRRQEAATPPPPVVERSRVRAALMDFAYDLAGAEGRVALVRVLTDVDRYVERALSE